MRSCHHGHGAAGPPRQADSGQAGRRAAWPSCSPSSGRSSAAARPVRRSATAGLLPGEMLLAGQSISTGRDILTMQADGNLVLYAPGSIPVWASDTAGHGGAQLVMRADSKPGGRRRLRLAHQPADPDPLG